MIWILTDESILSEWVFGSQVDIRFEEEGGVQDAPRILACGWWVCFLSGQKYKREAVLIIQVSIWNN